MYAVYKKPLSSANVRCQQFQSVVQTNDRTAYVESVVSKRRIATLSNKRFP